MPDAAATGTSIALAGLVCGHVTFAALETYIEHHPRDLGDPAAARRRFPHSWLRSAFLDQHPADNLRVHPRHRPCRLDYLLPLKGARTASVHLPLIACSDRFAPSATIRSGSRLGFRVAAAITKGIRNGVRQTFGSLWEPSGHLRDGFWHSPQGAREFPQ